MLVNNNTQAVTTVQQLKRSDMDPANAAASALYSGALQAAQQSVTVPAAQKELDKAADRIDEAFAKTRVQLQTSATDALGRGFAHVVSEFRARRRRRVDRWHV